MVQSPWQHGGPIHPATFGAILRDARLGLGRSLQDAERQTRILARHLTALENGDFHLLPSGIYARGFVYNYANWLQLNPQEMVRLFNEARGEPEVAYRPLPVGRPLNTSGPFSPNFVVIVFVIGILSVVAAWGYSLLVQSPPKKAIIDVPTVPATPTAIVGGTAQNSPIVTPVSGASTIKIPSAPATGTDITGTVPAGTAGTAGITGTPTAPTALKVTLKATEDSWIQVYVDGDKTAKYNQLLKAGDTKDIEAQQTIRVIVGKPTSVSYTVNGQDKGTFPKDALQLPGFSITP